MNRQKPDSGGFEFKVDGAEQSLTWNSKKVEQLMVAIEEGYKPKSHPFHEGNPNLRKGNIVFNYTSEELKEIRRCATDIVYFANTYCTVMTDDGLMKIKLRPYQENMLKQFQEERFNICLAARQVGKCLSFSTQIYLFKDGGGIKTTIGNLYFTQLKLRRRLTIFEKIKWFLWKAYTWLDSLDKKQDNH